MNLDSPQDGYNIARTDAKIVSTTLSGGGGESLCKNFYLRNRGSSHSHIVIIHTLTMSFK